MTKVDSLYCYFPNFESRTMNRKEQQDISRKLKVLDYAKEIGNISKTCRYFGICRETLPGIPGRPRIEEGTALYYSLLERQGCISKNCDLNSVLCGFEEEPALYYVY